MKIRHYLFIPMCFFAIGIMTAANLAWAGNTPPAPIKALTSEGLKMAGHFKAPNGMTGYAATYQGHPITVYVTPDGQHAIIGTMIDAKGNDLSAAPLKRLVSAPKYQKAWRKLEQSNWIADGSKHAKRIIYMFTDANCPYCHKFWLASRPWVKAGKVQIRHIMVAILRPSSMPKAAAILSASDPSAALARDEHNYDSGGIKPMSDAPADVKAKIKANNRLMKSLGLFATPTIFYHDADGHVAVKQGLPQGKTFTAVMGGPRPK